MLSVALMWHVISVMWMLISQRSCSGNSSLLTMNTWTNDKHLRVPKQNLAPLAVNSCCMPDWCAQSSQAKFCSRCCEFMLDRVDWHGVDLLGPWHVISNCLRMKQVEPGTTRCVNQTRHFFFCKTKESDRKENGKMLALPVQCTWWRKQNMLVKMFSTSLWSVSRTIDNVQTAMLATCKWINLAIC